MELLFGGKINTEKNALHNETSLKKINYFNYSVENLKELLIELKKEGVIIVHKMEEYKCVKLELW
jgi:hypothetical protein